MGRHKIYTEEELAERRRAYHREYQRKRRARMTPAELDAYRERHKMRQRQYAANRTDEDRRIMALQRRLYLESLTAEEKEERRAKRRQARREKIANMSEEERKDYYAKKSAYDRQWRAKRKARRQAKGKA